MWNSDEEVLPLQDYGGFVTLTMLKQTEQQFRCAATLAPVIDWSLYGKLGEVIGGRDHVTPVVLKHTRHAASRVCCLGVKGHRCIAFVAASVFSERYLGLPSTHSSRYQVST